MKTDEMCTRKAVALAKESLRREALKELSYLGEKKFDRYDEIIETIRHLDKIEEIFVLLFNLGYDKGNEDTVEGRFTFVHQSAMRSHHSDVVQEIELRLEQADELQSG